MTTINKQRQTKVGKITKSEISKINSSSSRGMKLPAWRKLHFKVSHIIAAILILLVIAFFARVAIWEHGYIKRMEGSERATSSLNADIEGEEAVDKTEPTASEVAEYTVAADRPRYLNIPSIGLNQARIIEIGTKSNGELATPYNIYDIGWYNKSALPGSHQVVVMDAHGGAPGIGAFGNLPQIKPGDEIKIEMGDGREFTYTVVDTATKALGEEADHYMVTAFESPEDGKGSLTLITCTGVYWTNSRTYSHRFFARAILK